jgi:hypothetical protein
MWRTYVEDSKILHGSDAVLTQSICTVVISDLEVTVNPARCGCFLIDYSIGAALLVSWPRNSQHKSIVIPGNPGEGRGRPGIQEFQNHVAGKL